MNWFTRLFNSAVSQAQAEIRRLSALDGKPGLSMADIGTLGQKIAHLATIDASGAEKHRLAVAWLIERLGTKIPRGYAEIIVYLAYQIAKNTVLKKLQK
jgi:hypothetical protein